MLEFKILEKLKPNEEILISIKDHKYKIIKGKAKTLLHTNLQFIEPNNYYSLSLIKLENNEYTDKEINFYNELIQEHFYFDGVIKCPYYDGKNIADRLLLIPKTRVNNFEK